MFSFAMRFENITPYIIRHVGSKDTPVQILIDIVCFEFKAHAHRLRYTVWFWEKEVQSEFVVEFSWHEWLQEDFHLNVGAECLFSPASVPNVFASWDHSSNV